MSVEIELKVWVDDRPHVEAELQRRFGVGEQYHKSDRYFSVTCGESPVEFRLRQDGERTVFTHKAKKIHDGIETSQENEFDVPEPRAFERFIHTLGAHEYIRKEKIGRRFRSGDMVLELSEVVGLGDFLELELLVSEEAAGEPARHAACVRRLHTMLDELELSRSRIEATPYTVLLAERANRPAAEKKKDHP
ncbi:MAG: class IV adenylate cyclase [Spirochaeta sp.]|nr:class IV adenylate cyclase [Spirochaeta sp.]